MPKNLILIGGGGHALGLIDILLSQRRKILGVVDGALEKNKAWNFGLRVLGNDDVLDDYSPEDVELVNGVGYLPGKPQRSILFNKFQTMGFSFANVIDNSANVGQGVKLGQGVQILRNSVVNTFASIEDNVIVNTAAIVEHSCRIGAHSHLAPGSIVCGDCVLEEACFVGAGSVVIQGARLSANAVVPAKRWDS